MEQIRQPKSFFAKLQGSADMQMSDAVMPACMQSTNSINGRTTSCNQFILPRVIQPETWQCRILIALFEIALTIKNEKLNLKNAGERYFGKN